MRFLCYIVGRTDTSDGKGGSVMDEAALQHAFAQCLPLAERLETQGFDCICTEADLPTLQLLDEAQRAINADETWNDQRFMALIEAADLTSKRFSWLICLQRTDRQVLQQRLTRGPHPYRPLAERLQALERGVLYSQAQGIIRFDEDPELCHLPQTIVGPADLLRAERYWEAFNRGFSGLEEE